MRARTRMLALTAALLGITGCRIDLAVTGEGRVETLSGTFACDSNGGDCTQEYDAPTNEVFIAEPLPGHTLSSWSGCVYRDIRSCEVAVVQEAIDRDLTLAINASYQPIKRPIEAASYTYNALGQRVSKTVGGTTTLFVYDLAGKLLAELDEQGRPVREHILLDSVPIAQVTTAGDGSEATHYVHSDHLGAARLLTDRHGIIRWAREETPFGETLAHYEEVAYNLRFPGQYADRERGLNYNYFRDYDPSLGRYIQSDPIGLQGGLNTYAYVGGNPLIYSDPYGLFVCNLLGLIPEGESINLGGGLGAYLAASFEFSFDSSGATAMAGGGFGGGGSIYGTYSALSGRINGGGVGVAGTGIHIGSYASVSGGGGAGGSTSITIGSDGLGTSTNVGVGLGAFGVAGGLYAKRKFFECENDEECE